MHPGDRPYLCRGEFSDRPALLLREPEDPAVNSAWQLIRRNPLASIGLVLIAIFVSLALLAPWISPQDPAHIDLPSRLQNASHAHWLGTDELGRDILSRIIYGARISMLVGVSVVAGSLFLGL